MGSLGPPWWLSGKESAFQCKRHGFDPWSGTIPHASHNQAWAPQLLSPYSRAQEPQLLRPRSMTIEARAP